MKYTFAEFKKDFPNNDAILERILEANGGRERECPKCKRQTKFYRIRKRQCYSCQWCGAHMYPAVGTVFDRRRTGLDKWFYAMLIITSDPYGVNGPILAKALGTNRWSAWRMIKRLRQPLIESLDETYDLTPD